MSLAAGTRQKHDARRTIIAHPALAAALLDREFPIHGLGHRRFRTFEGAVLVSQGTCRGAHRECEDVTCDAQIWDLPSDRRALIEDVLADRTTLPCGHPPFRNPRGVDGLTCLDEECTETYSRDVVRAVMRDE